MQDDDVDGDGAVPQIYRDLHGGPMGTWYAKDGQMALRETHGPFPASAAGLESWAALEEITQAFHEHPDSATAPEPAAAPAPPPSPPPPADDDGAYSVSASI